MTEAENPPSPAVSGLVAKWNQRLDSAIKDDKRKKRLERNKKLRNYVRGCPHGEGEKDPEEVTANIVLGMIQTLIPLYYAKDPELDVSPDEQVEDASYGAIRGFADTSRVLLNRKFVRETRLKQKITRSIPSALTSGVAWLKMIYQRDIVEDPLIRNRINDLQDNLSRIQHLAKEAEEEPAERDEYELQLQQQIKVLQQQLEREVASGLVIDVVSDDDIVILDHSLTTFSEYTRSRAIAHLIWMECDEYEEKFGKEPTGTKYGDKAEDKGNSTQKDKKEFVRVAEIWCMQDHLVYTMELGAKEWAREPYSPAKQGERWYPFFALYWNELDGQLYPISDVEQWVGLQDEYNRMRTQQAQVRKENRPGFIFRLGGSLTEEDLERIRNRKGNTLVGVQTDGSNAPLNQDIAPFPTFTLDPTVFDASMIQRDLEQVSGASDAARAAINKAKTATEAEIQAQGMQTRTAYRQDNVEEFVAEMALYAWQVLLQEMTPEEVTAVAGQGAVWPMMARPEIYQMLRVGVRAGSTGKPNGMQKRQDWVQLAPQIVQFIQQIYQFRAQGMMNEAEGLLALLTETLKAFDVRIDLEEFFPPMEPGAMPPMQGPVIEEMMNAIKALAAEQQQMKASLTGQRPTSQPAQPGV